MNDNDIAQVTSGRVSGSDYSFKRNLDSRRHTWASDCHITMMMITDGSGICNPSEIYGRG